MLGPIRKRVRIGRPQALRGACASASATLRSFLRISHSAKAFLSLVLLHAVMMGTYTIVLLTKLDLGTMDCRDPSEDQCFDPRNAEAVAVPLVVWSIALMWLVLSAISQENSEQLVLTLGSMSFQFFVLVYENSRILLKDW